MTAEELYSLKLDNLKLIESNRELAETVNTLIRRLNYEAPGAKYPWEVEWSRMSGREKETCLTVFSNWRRIKGEELIKLAQWDAPKDFNQELVDRINRIGAGRRYANSPDATY